MQPIVHCCRLERASCAHSALGESVSSSSKPEHTSGEGEGETTDEIRSSKAGLTREASLNARQACTQAHRPRVLRADSTRSTARITPHCPSVDLTQLTHSQSLTHLSIHRITRASMIEKGKKKEKEKEKGKKKTNQTYSVVFTLATFARYNGYHLSPRWI